jgi:hypothetical protein
LGTPFQYKTLRPLFVAYESVIKNKVLYWNGVPDNKGKQIKLNTLPDEVEPHDVVLLTNSSSRMPIAYEFVINNNVLYWNGVPNNKGKPIRLHTLSNTTKALLGPTQ